MVEQFWKEMEEKVKRIEAGDEETPSWWQPELAETLDENIVHWRDTAELILCLSDRKTGGEAVEGMVRHCFRDRWWSAWERARIWDKLIAMGPEILPELRTSPRSKHP